MSDAADAVNPPPFSTAVRLDSYRGDASEDRAGIFTAADGSPVVVVADGVGGRPGGGQAATRLLEVIGEFAMQAPTTRDHWARLLAHADSVISEDPDVGETTGVVAQVTPHRRIVGAYVGDSEAWCITEAGHRSLTERGEKPWLGSGGARPIPFATRIPASGATLLVATDGLFRYARAEAIAEAALLPELEEAMATLALLPRRPSGQLPDDLAIVICRIPATEPAVRRFWRIPPFRG